MKINRPLNTRSYCNKIGNDLRGLKSNVPGFSNQYSHINLLVRLTLRAGLKGIKDLESKNI